MLTACRQDVALRWQHRRGARKVTGTTVAAIECDGTLVMNTRRRANRCERSVVMSVIRNGLLFWMPVAWDTRLHPVHRMLAERHCDRSEPLQRQPQNHEYSYERASHRHPVSILNWAQAMDRRRSHQTSSGDITARTTSWP